jgi:hypothetical protein
VASSRAEQNGNWHGGSENVRSEGQKGTFPANQRIHMLLALSANALVGIVIAAFGAIWGTVALLYARKHPEKLTGMDYRTFRLVIGAAIAISLVSLVAIPLIL